MKQQGMREREKKECNKPKMRNERSRGNVSWGKKREGKKFLFGVCYFGEGKTNRKAKKIFFIFKQFYKEYFTVNKRKSR